MTGSTTPQFGIDTTVPTTARIYDYWLGGHDNFAAWPTGSSAKGQRGGARGAADGKGEPQIPAPRGSLPGRQGASPVPDLDLDLAERHLGCTG